MSPKCTADTFVTVKKSQTFIGFLKLNFPSVEKKTSLKPKTSLEKLQFEFVSLVRFMHKQPDDVTGMSVRPGN